MRRMKKRKQRERESVMGLAQCFQTGLTVWTSVEILLFKGPHVALRPPKYPKMPLKLVCRKFVKQKSKLKMVRIIDEEIVLTGAPMSI
jgi:hypothetical protein